MIVYIYLKNNNAQGNLYSDDRTCIARDSNTLHFSSSKLPLRENITPSGNLKYHQLINIVNRYIKIKIIYNNNSLFLCY